MTPSTLQQLALTIVRRKPGIKRVALAKLIYLVDWEHMCRTGRTLTGVDYVRAERGPLAGGLDQSLGQMDGHEMRITGNREIGYSHFPLSQTARFEPGFTTSAVVVIDYILDKYVNCSWPTLVGLAYATTPMRVVLELEGKGRSMKNRRMDLESLCRQDALWRYQKRAHNLSFNETGTAEERIDEHLAGYLAMRRSQRRATTTALNGED